MEENINWYLNEKINRTIKNFRKNSINAKYFESRVNLIQME